jgi:hypothetical protein
MSDVPEDRDRSQSRVTSITCVVTFCTLGYIAEATQRILTDYADVFPETTPHGTPPPPPLREVNHTINLIDPNIRPKAKVYSIPLKYEQQIRDQVNAYCDSDWFFPMATDDTAPAFTAPKKDPTQGRLVVDLRQRNANTIRDESPIPDMRTPPDHTVSPEAGKLQRALRPAPEIYTLT